MDKYFTYDPENNEFETHATPTEQAAAAKEIIEAYLDVDGSWPEEVTGIVSGVITERATECNTVKRPEKVGNDGFDKDGRYWPEDIDHFCSYEMIAL